MMMDTPAVTFAIQLMFVGAFGFFGILLMYRIMGGPVLFETRRRQVGSLLFCVGMFAWEFWWMLRWALKVAESHETSQLFVSNVSYIFPGPFLAAIGLSIYLSDILTPVFRNTALPVALVIIIGPLIAGVIVG